MGLLLSSGCATSAGVSTFSEEEVGVVSINGDNIAKINIGSTNKAWVEANIGHASKVMSKAGGKELWQYVIEKKSTAPAKKVVWYQFIGFGNDRTTFERFEVIFKGGVVIGYDSTFGARAGNPIDE